MGADRGQDGAKKAFDKIKDRSGRERDERKAQLEERERQERLERELEDTYGDTEDAIRSRAAVRQ
jgi:hypothetical protein